MREKTEAGREASLLKILSERGLHPKSSADQIQRVRAEVELAKDLDGIDASNVIEGGRRRRAATVNQWGQAIDYRKANGGGSDSDASESSDESASDTSSSEEDPEAFDEEEEKGAKGAKKANETPGGSGSSSARAKEKSGPLASPAEEGVDVFFENDDSSDEDAPGDDDTFKPSSAKKARSEPSEPAERKAAPAKTDAPRRGAALLDSDDDE